jgi:hypothetical protein
LFHGIDGFQVTGSPITKLLGTPWEALSTRATLMKTPYEVLSAFISINRALGTPQENLAALKTFLTKNYEASGKRTSLKAFSYEAIGKVTGQGRSNYEFRKILSGQRTAVYEALKLVQSLKTTNNESIQGIANALLAPYESLKSLSITRRAVYEALIGIRTRKLTNEEALSSINLVARALATNQEALGILLPFRTANYEDRARVVGTRRAAYEFLIKVSDSLNVQAEALGAVFPVGATAKINQERLVGLFHAALSNYEEKGFVPTITQLIVNQEAAGRVASGALTPYEELVLQVSLVLAVGGVAILQALIFAGMDVEPALTVTKVTVGSTGSLR